MELKQRLQMQKIGAAKERLFRLWKLMANVSLHKGGIKPASVFASPAWA